MQKLSQIFSKKSKTKYINKSIDSNISGITVVSSFSSSDKIISSNLSISPAALLKYENGLYSIFNQIFPKLYNNTFNSIFDRRNRTFFYDMKNIKNAKNTAII